MAENQPYVELINVVVFLYFSTLFLLGCSSSSSFYHPQCWSIGRKLKQDGITAQSFVDSVLQDETEERILKDADYKDNLIAELEKGSGTKKRSIDDVKGEGTAPAAESGPETPIHELYSGMKTDELKDVLRWNKQTGLSGKKDELLLRCVDGHMNGRIGLCPSCEEGKLKLANSTTVSCSGYFDEENQVRHPCFFSCKVNEAPRLYPWYTAAPPEEEDQEQENNTSAQKKKKIGGKGNKQEKNADALKDFLPYVESIPWDLSSVASIKKVGDLMFDACKAYGRLNLPNDDRGAKIEIGRIILGNKENSCAADICSLIIDHFGLKLSDTEKEAKHKTMSSLCACPANGLVYEIMNELGKVYFEEGNTMGTYLNRRK